MRKGCLIYVLSIFLIITLSACGLPVPTHRVDPSVDKTTHIMPGKSSKADVRKLLGEPILSPEGLDVDVYYFPGYQKYITLAFFLIPFPETREIKSYALVTYDDGIVSEMDIGGWENYNNDILIAGRYEFDCHMRTLLVINQSDQLLTTEEVFGANTQTDSCSVFIESEAAVFIDKSFIGAFYGSNGYFHRSVSPGLHEISGCYLRFRYSHYFSSDYNPDCPKMDFTCTDRKPIYFELNYHREKKFFGDDYKTVSIKKNDERPEDLLERRLILGQRFENLSSPGASIPTTANVVTYESKKGEITFNHQTHQERFDCSKCHEGTPAKIEVDKDYGHKTCVSCHKEMNGPMKCNDCHKE